MPGRTNATTAPTTGKRGRPSSLSAETTKLFTQALLALNTIEDAATISGVHRGTVLRWLATGRKATRGEYRDFYDAVEAAKAKAKVSLVAVVAAGARRDPKLALEVLARRHPAEWARHDKLDVHDKTPPGKRDGLRDKILGKLDQIEDRLRARSITTTDEP